jgi:hypothetical protein
MLVVASDVVDATADGEEERREKKHKRRKKKDGEIMMSLVVANKVETISPQNPNSTLFCVER